MPDMNGLLLCEKLKDYSFKKILYTGTEDYQAGLEAMNANLIENFIGKSTSPETLINKIEEFTFKYFSEQTFALKKYLEVDNLLPLSDKLFVNYFIKLLSTKNIIKYCLIDKHGSVLMTDNVGNTSVLIVHTEKSINQFLKLISDDVELSELYDIVFKKLKIPNVDYNQPYLDFKTIDLYEPSVLIGRENYYIHYLEG